MEISNAMLASALVKVKEYEVSAIPDNSYIDHTFSLEFETSMDNLISSLSKKEKPVSFYRNALTKAAVIIIVLCVGTFSLMMMSPQARADFGNAVVEFYETHIKFYFVTNAETPTDFSNYKNVYVEYIPEGFLLKEKYEEYEAIGYRYENETENLVYDVYVSLNEGLSILTDKDKNNIEKINISGRESYLVSGENDGKPYSTLILTGNKITVTIYGHLSMEEVVKIGESVKEK